MIQYRLDINFISIFIRLLFYSIFISCFILLYKFISCVYINSTYTYNYHKLFCWIVAVFCAYVTLHVFLMCYGCFWFACLYAYVSYIVYPIRLFLTLLRIYWMSVNKDKDKDSWRAWIKFFYHPAACMCNLLRCCVQFLSSLSENNF